MVRDCEWIVRSADPCDEDGYILTVDRISELVRCKSAPFLTHIVLNVKLFRKVSWLRLKEVICLYTSYASENGQLRSSNTGILIGQIL